MWTVQDQRPGTTSRDLFPGSRLYPLKSLGTDILEVNQISLLPSFTLTATVRTLNFDKENPNLSLRISQ